jgi:small-conductance mechanosensitive channel
MVAEESTFRGVIGFFNKIGIYDVVLPFLLVFTIMFAILEKTRVLGIEKDKDGVEMPKKNLNSLVAFCIGFFVVASSKIVAVINQSLAQVVLLVLVAVCFLMLIGTFRGTEEIKLSKDEPLMIFFMIAMGIGVVLIFLNALGWLIPIINFLKANWNTNAVASIILIIIIIVFIIYVTKEKTVKKEKEKKD